MTGLRLYKKEKLCSSKAIDMLFAAGGNCSSALAYPVRCVWRINESRHADCPQFLVVVPKKRLRHAVDRVTMRRRIREAYRLNRDLLPRDVRVDISFIYVAQSLTDYHLVEHGMKKLLRRIAESLPVES